MTFQNNMVAIGYDVSGTSLSNNLIINGIYETGGTNNFISIQFILVAQVLSATINVTRCAASQQAWPGSIRTIFSRTPGLAQESIMQYSCREPAPIPQALFPVIINFLQMVQEACLEFMQEVINIPSSMAVGYRTGRPVSLCQSWP